MHPNPTHPNPSHDRKGVSVLSRALISLTCLAPAAVPAPTRIDDPLRFVTGVFRHFVAAQSTKRSYEPPEDFYTPQLEKLIRADKKQANGEVGCLDFVFWTGGQDWTIKQLKITSEPGTPDRQTVIASFLNLDGPTEIHFDFRRLNGRWLLDDARSVKEPRWILSKILKCAP